MSTFGSVGVTAESWEVLLFILSFFGGFGVLAALGAVGWWAISKLFKGKEG